MFLKFYVILDFVYCTIKFSIDISIIIMSANNLVLSMFLIQFVCEFTVWLDEKFINFLSCLFQKSISKATGIAMKIYEFFVEPYQELSNGQINKTAL
ncbi:hypothetical protein BpHYR1_039872 [Brachionus plicatilis]|uniref:Uncharacterized protein n=1 Tax=Brachionus plicatilis TaxID=10195 RepID=A0A3M7PEM4_BRAPC|nr:hypothetical protein BpHYR1_039872 [Brachionus plicatilis]